MDRVELGRLLGTAVNEAVRIARTATVVGEREPGAFMTAFACAVAAGGPVFLVDPNWGDAERKRLGEILVANEVARTTSEGPGSSVAEPTAETVKPRDEIRRGWLCIPSGGSSGSLKFARHDEFTIATSVKGFCTHFGLERVNALGFLPLYHVSGLMAWMRCALTGGQYQPGDWKSLSSGELPDLPRGEAWVVSLVPTQLQRLLESPRAVTWLKGFRVIFVGGGPVWPELTEAAASAGLPISLSYGMTETAAMVAALTPAEFLAGERSVGRTLPHAQVTISNQGCVHIESDALFRGYWPTERNKGGFETADLGRIDDRGHLHIVGRSDALIITGGEKVSPAEVELALRATGQFSDVAVIGLANAEWGQIVVACYPAGKGAAPDPKSVIEQLGGLAIFKRPKRYVEITAWPRNAQGKVNRAELAAIVNSQL